MVVFKDDPEKYNNPAAYLKIQEDMISVMELNKKIIKMDEEINLTPMVRIFLLFPWIFKLKCDLILESVCEKVIWNSGWRCHVKPNPEFPRVSNFILFCFWMALIN